MAILDIKKAGDKVLKQVAAPVEKIDRKIRQLLDDMAETMYEADGVGLAAPQVGVSLRIIIVDVGDGLIEFINPVLVATEGEQTGPEGCLSVPEIYGDVVRFEKAVVRGFNRNGKQVEITGTGFLARALQHEIDHLDGVLFIEKAQTISKR